MTARREVDWRPEVMRGRLRDARMQRGFSQVAAARELGISSSSLSMVEAGVRAGSIELLWRLAQLYEVSMSWLAGDDDGMLLNPLADESLGEVLRLWSVLDAEGRGSLMQFARFCQWQQGQHS